MREKIPKATNENLVMPSIPQSAQIRDMIIIKKEIYSSFKPLFPQTDARDETDRV